MPHIESVETKPDRFNEVREQFCAMFRRGYTSFAETEIRAFPLEMAGYNAAVRYRARHPGSVERVLTAFGYKKETHTGIWRIAFETSLFVNDNVPKPGWWVRYCPECEKGKLNWKRFPKPGWRARYWPEGERFPKFPADRNIPAKLRALFDDRHGAEAKVRVTGYLSPVGKYGYLGSYSQEFLATNIQPIDQPTPETTRQGDAKTRDDAYRSYDGQPHPTEGTNEQSDAPKDRASRDDKGKPTAGPR